MQRHPNDVNEIYRMRGLLDRLSRFAQRGLEWIDKGQDWPRRDIIDTVWKHDLRIYLRALLTPDQLAEIARKIKSSRHDAGVDNLVRLERALKVLADFEALMIPGLGEEAKREEIVARREEIVAEIRRRRAASTDGEVG